MKKVVGIVTEDEKLAIMKIYRHQQSLQELLQILQKDDVLYNEATKDLEETNINYQVWWNNSYEKYQWEKGESNWRIIFESNEIVIE